MKIISLIFSIVLGFSAVSLYSKTPSKPNIIYILADDLGYGDVQILNATRGKIPTPHLDQLAQEGMIFTDAHTNSSVCTPTRYGIMTGRYCWRTLASGVLSGTKPPLIPPDRMTVPSFLKSQGYQTACIGKWHLGMNLPFTSENKKEIDWSKSILNGPTTLGFDYYFGVSASLDMSPYVFIENDHFTTTKVTTTQGSSGGQGHFRPGWMAEGFAHEEVLPQLTEKATAYIREQAKKPSPFFLYFPMTGPHTPILPTKEFKGKSHLNDYADFCMEVDAMVGKVLSTLEETGIAQNTWVILTSDNGCSAAAKIPDLEAMGHYPSAQFRGHKAEIYDGGHRVPFLMRWPNQIPAGRRCDELICHTDFLATCAELFGQRLPDNAGEDSVSFLPAMLGKPHDVPLREAVVHHAINGAFAIRQGPWKLELCADRKAGKGAPAIQLYNLSRDIAEQQNVANENPEIVKNLTALLKKYADEGRSTLGKPQKNEIAVDLFVGKKITGNEGKEE